MKEHVVNLLKHAGIHVYMASETKLNDEDVKIELIVENRRSGKTSRKILRAIADASDGNNVFFICRNSFTARDEARRARKVADMLGIVSHAVEDRVDIGGVGSVRFMSSEKFERNPDLSRGIRNIIEVWDM